jgi:hypothetical protein
MWNELARTGSRYKERTEVAVNNPLIDLYWSCPACCEANKRAVKAKEKNRCVYCPLWKCMDREEQYQCMNDEQSEYREWLGESDDKKRMKIAKKIANMKWK